MLLSTCFLSRDSITASALFGVTNTVSMAMKYSLNPMYLWNYLRQFEVTL
jgi:hypothetical protein